MEKYMDEALIEANKGHLNGEVPVGCVFVLDNKIVARAHNFVNATKNATRHAEFLCIDTFYKFCEENSFNIQKSFENVTVVVTVEPCIMCATALINLNVIKIIYGCPNDRFGGTTVLNVTDIIKKNIDFGCGIRSSEAMKLLKEFYKGVNPAAPVSNIKK